MDVKLLKTLRYSIDGIKATSFTKGDVVSIKDDAVSRKMIDQGIATSDLKAELPKDAPPIVPPKVMSDEDLALMAELKITPEEFNELSESDIEEYRDISNVSKSNNPVDPNESLDEDLGDDEKISGGSEGDKTNETIVTPDKAETKKGNDKK
jgi:hypothetical protein